MDAQRRGSTSRFEVRDPWDMEEPKKKRPEGVFIGEALQRLAESEGIENPHQFAIRYGISYKHLSNLWTNRRHAGLPTITDLAKKSGRAVAFFFGEESGLPVLGAMDAIGRIDMDTRQNAPHGLITLPEACPPYFPAGARLVLEPSVFRADTWLVVRTKATDDTWIAWASTKAEMQLLAKPGGETVLFSDDAHEVVGAIADVIVRPPRPMSA